MDNFLKKTKKGNLAMINGITELFCWVDDFCQYAATEAAKHQKSNTVA
jgi:hypothetical protein